MPSTVPRYEMKVNESRFMEGGGVGYSIAGNDNPGLEADLAILKKIIMQISEADEQELFKMHYDLKDNKLILTEHQFELVKTVSQETSIG